MFLLIMVIIIYKVNRQRAQNLRFSICNIAFRPRFFSPRPTRGFPARQVLIDRTALADPANLGRREIFAA